PAAPPPPTPPVPAQTQPPHPIRPRVQAHPEKYAAGPRTAYEAHAIDAPPKSHTPAPCAAPPAR
ncbi:baseplate protein, partial [Neisseria gonorrhoeae]